MNWHRFFILAIASYSLLHSGCQASSNWQTLQTSETNLPLLDRPNSEQVIRKIRTINAPRTIVWNILADYGNVHQFVASIKDSKIISGPPQGVGAVRQCTVAMGMKVTEDVAIWDHGNRMVLNMQSPIPVDNHIADFQLRDNSHGQTEIVFVMKYNTRAGIIGRTMNAVFLKTSMERSMNELLDGLENFIANGYAQRQNQ